MKRPAWAVAVGIIGIVFGCFGILGAGQTIIMPTILELQKQMFTEMQKAYEEGEKRETRKKAEAGTAEEQDGEQADNACPGAGKHRLDSFPPFRMFGVMEKLWEFPPWYKTWCVAAGIAGVFVSGFYILASIFILLVKKSGIRLFYWAAGLSIGFTVVKAAVGVTANPIMGLSMMIWGAVGAVVTAVLLIVVATSDKEAFE